MNMNHLTNNNNNNNTHSLSDSMLNTTYQQHSQQIMNHDINKQQLLEKSQKDNNFWTPSNLSGLKQELYRLPNQDPFQPFSMAAINQVTNLKTTQKICGWGNCMNIALIQSLCHLHAAKYQAGQPPPNGIINTNKFIETPSIPPHPSSFMESLAEAVSIGDDLSYSIPSSRPTMPTRATNHSVMPSTNRKKLPVPPVASVIDSLKSKKNTKYKACKEENCIKYAQRHGLCRKHEKMKNGEITKTRTRNKSGRIYRMCCYHDCDKHSQKYHLCRTHEKLLAEEAHKESKKSSVSYDELFKKKLAGLKLCRHPGGCRNVIRANGRCTDHLKLLESKIDNQKFNNNNNYFNTVEEPFQQQMINHDTNRKDLSNSSTKIPNNDIKNQDNSKHNNLTSSIMI